MEEDEVMNYSFMSEREAKPTVKRGGSQVQGPGAPRDKYLLYLYLNLSRVLGLVAVGGSRNLAASKLRLVSRCLGVGS
jgi:hypothetical protein